MYLLSDFLGLWQAMQFLTRIGAISFMKLTPLADGLVGAFFSSAFASGFFSSDF